MAGTRVSPAVAETVLALVVAPEDAGLVRLAERYAAAIDEAAEIAEAAATVDTDTVEASRALAAVQKRVEHQAVLAELGPKLLAALAELGASPKSRAAMHRGGGAAGDSDPSQAELDRVRAGRFGTGQSAG